MGTIKASMVVMSHLSDAQEEMNNAGNRIANHRINFVKYIILETNGDLTKEIDPDKMYDDF
jgi:hypothetical protein